jgi:hypothetical protein
MSKKIKFIGFGIVALTIALFNLKVNQSVSPGSLANKLNIKNIQIMQASASEVYICYNTNTSPCSFTLPDGTKCSAMGPFSTY